MMEKQVVAPRELQLLQAEFGKSIRTPFSFATGHFACQLERYSVAVVSLIAPRGALLGEARLAVYNEQYWYRLLTAMQSNFPLLVARLGYWKFNQLATNYLDLHGSSTPYLENIPALMDAFIATHNDYGQMEQIQMVAVDMAFIRATYMPVTKPLDPSQLSSEALDALGEEVLLFQPGFSLVAEDWNWMEVRIAIAAEDLVTPAVIAQKSYWAVSNRNALVAWEALDRLQFLMLNALKLGFSLGDACEKVCQTLSVTDQEKLMAHLSGWFALWTQHGYFQHPES